MGEENLDLQQLLRERHSSRCLVRISIKAIKVGDGLCTTSHGVAIVLQSHFVCARCGLMAKPGCRLQLKRSPF